MKIRVVGIVASALMVSIVHAADTIRVLRFGSTLDTTPAFSTAFSYSCHNVIGSTVTFNAWINDNHGAPVSSVPLLYDADDLDGIVGAYDIVCADYEPENIWVPLSGLSIGQSTGSNSACPQFAWDTYSPIAVAYYGFGDWTDSSKRDIVTDEDGFDSDTEILNYYKSLQVSNGVCNGPKPGNIYGASNSPAADYIVALRGQQWPLKTMQAEFGTSYPLGMWAQPYITNVSSWDSFTLNAWTVATADYDYLLPRVYADDINIGTSTTAERAAWQAEKMDEMDFINAVADTREVILCVSAYDASGVPIPWGNGFDSSGNPIYYNYAFNPPLYDPPGDPFVSTSGTMTPQNFARAYKVLVEYANPDANSDFRCVVFTGNATQWILQGWYTLGSVGGYTDQYDVYHEISGSATPYQVFVARAYRAIVSDFMGWEYDEDSDWKPELHTESALRAACEDWADDVDYWMNY